VSDLEQLEEDLNPRLQRALDEMMPRLEQPLAGDRDGVRGTKAGGGDVTVIAATSAVPKPRARLAVAVALTALAAGTVATLGWLSRDGRELAPGGSVEPQTSTAPTDGETPTVSSAATSLLPASSIVGDAGSVFPLDGLDPVNAARNVSIAARIEPTPDEQADLQVAREILRRECMRDGGANPPPITAADHQAVRDNTIEQLRFRVRTYTTQGIETLRTDGYFAELRHERPDPLHLELHEASNEDQLRMGCNHAVEALEASPTEQELFRLMAEPTDGRWTELNLLPSRLPEYAAEYRNFDACITAAGYPTYGDVGDTSPLWEFNPEEPAGTEELALARADADCRMSTGLPTTYVETVGSILDDFERQYASELTTVRTERDTALAIARTVLASHDIEPFTT
jgi:hypothetical protein